MLRYQPIIDLATGAPTGYEAVAQWRRPGVGVLPVPEIRPDAEFSRPDLRPRRLGNARGRPTARHLDA